MKIIIFTTAPAARVRHLLWRLAIDVPEIKVAGIVYTRPRGRPPLGRLVAGCRALLVGAADEVIRWAHAAPQHPNGPPPTLKHLARECEAAGIGFLVVRAGEPERVAAFVRQLAPDLGVALADDGLDPQLLGLPARGSVRIAEDPAPTPGGRTVTARRLGQPTGPPSNHLGERFVPAAPLDVPSSVELKVAVVAVDLLVDVLRAECSGTAPPVLTGPGGCGRSDGPGRPPVYPPESGSRPPHKLLLRTLAYPLLFLRNFRRRWRRSFPVVVLFHHLVGDRPHYLGMSTAAFARHVRYLKKHYRIASLDEAVESLRTGGCSVPTVVLTFDDGYADNFLGLRAVAEAEGVPVALFVCSRKVSDATAFDHDLRRGQTDFPSLDWEQLRYLDRHNVTVGSHTLDHFDCGSTDRARLTEQMVGSAEEIRRELGHEVRFFAFPKGMPWNMSAPAVEIARETYPFFLSSSGGVNLGPLTTPGELKRSPHPTSLWELELQLQSVLEVRAKQRPAEQPPEVVTPVRTVARSPAEAAS